MNKFEYLNWLTQNDNNANVDRYNPSTPRRNNSSSYWLNQYNNQTYKQNNGQYSSKYY